MKQTKHFHIQPFTNKYLGYLKSPDHCKIVSKNFIASSLFNFYKSCIV